MIPMTYALLAVDEAEELHGRARALQTDAAIFGSEEGAAEARREASAELLRRVADLCAEARRIFSGGEFSFLDDTARRLVSEVQVYHETKVRRRPASAVMSLPIPVPAAPPPPPPSPDNSDAICAMGVHFDDQHWQATQAVNWYEEAVKLGHPRAKARLAQLRIDGRGVRQDHGIARKLLEEAVTAGFPAAGVHLGKMALYGQGMQASLFKADECCARALPELRPRADAGDVEAMMALAWALQKGIGVYRDEPAAIALYRRAAEAGSLAAQTELGLLHDAGAGVPQDRKEAVHWLLRAAAQGYAPAQAHFAEIHDAHWFRPSGPGTDFAIAREWYGRAAAQEHPLGLYGMGACWLAGRGGPRDDGQAFRLWTEAAKSASGRVRMMTFHALGKCHEKGLGTAKDPDAAVRTWRESAAMAYAPAQYDLGVHYEAVAADPHEAVQWYFLAASQGHGPAALAMGDACRAGRGTPVDLAAAEKWYAAAAGKGLDAAIQKLAEVRRQRSGSAG